MHAPLVPYADRDAALRGEIEFSPWRLSLDGRWRFQLLDSPHDATPDFVAPDFDDAELGRASTCPSRGRCRATARPPTPTC